MKRDQQSHSQKQVHEMNEKKLMRAKELANYLCVSPQTLWRWRRNKTFPQPFQLGPRMIVWEVSTIDEWLNQQSK